jgi:hypothetical protein
LEDGQLIRTIEVGRQISSLIANQEAEDASSRQPDAANGNQPDKMTLTLRQGDRMLAVTGPSKVSRNLMISRGAEEILDCGEGEQASQTITASLAACGGLIVYGKPFPVPVPGSALPLLSSVDDVRGHIIARRLFMLELAGDFLM